MTTADVTTEEARWRALLAMAQNDLRLSLAPPDDPTSRDRSSPNDARRFAESALDKLQLAMKTLGVQPVERWWGEW